VITVRPLRDDEVDLYVEIRTRVHPQTPMPREVVVDDRKRPDHLDLIAELDGVPAGVASTSIYGGAPNGDLAFVTLRVPREYRRQGVGSALHRRASEHARSLGKERFYCVARGDDEDSLAYYSGRGYEEVGRMQDSFLDLACADLGASPAAGLEIVPIAPELERAVYEVAVEADADVPSGEAHESGTFDQWRERHFGSELILRDLSFAALEDGRAVGYALLGRHTEDTAENWMTGVARAARGRGIALALKRHQAVAARDAGWKHLRTQNDLGNAPMIGVNDRLGYEPRFQWVHLVGPLRL
jgi:GNAT superfamily N-acetyltransferase